VEHGSREGLSDFIAMRLLLKKKREDVDAYLAMLDCDASGFVSIEKINEALEAFGQKGLNAGEQHMLLQQYCRHSALNDDGEMEWWRLADVLQYSFMNYLYKG